MKCPHCGVGIAETWVFTAIGETEYTLNGESIGSHRRYRGSSPGLAVQRLACPECHGLTVELVVAIMDWARDNGPVAQVILSSERVWPVGDVRPIPDAVPKEYAADFREACAVLPTSPKASAALSRRCLQNLLHNHVRIKKDNLAQEVDALLASNELPRYIGESVDAIRNFGNFSAHPVKNEETGQVVDVEPNEAEWTLDVLEALFDHYFVRPKVVAAKREALNKKLTDAKKPPMKEPPT